MLGKIWNKFHPLFGPDLKVGLETTFPKAASLDLDPLYEKSGLVHNSPSEQTVRVYEPAVKVLGSCLDGEAAQIFFEPALLDGVLRRRLVFARKIDSSGKPRRRMVAARHNELFDFGFDSWNSRSERYLLLAYPGLNEQFIPVYVKIQNGKEEKEEESVFLEVWAWDECGKNVVVQARRVVSEEEVPKSLL